MTIERSHFNGPITFCCDECGELDDTHCENFGGALLKVKSHGWVVRKDGDDWLHICGGCK